MEEIGEIKCIPNKVLLNKSLKTIKKKLTIWMCDICWSISSAPTVCDAYGLIYLYNQTLTLTKGYIDNTPTKATNAITAAMLDHSEIEHIVVKSLFKNPFTDPDEPPTCNLRLCLRTPGSQGWYVGPQRIETFISEPELLPGTGKTKCVICCKIINKGTRQIRIQPPHNNQSIPSFHPECLIELGARVDEMDLMPSYINEIIST